MKPFNSQIYFSEIRDLPKFLFHFMQNPVRAIQTTPIWSWPSILSIQAGIAIVSGVCLAVVNRNFIDFLLGLFIFPFSSIIVSAVVSLFLYYFHAFFMHTFLEARRLYGIVVLANIPYLLFHILSGLVPPIDLIGFAFTSCLLVVGLVENFTLPKRSVIRLIGAVYAVFFLMWVSVQIKSTFRTNEKIQSIQPESLDKMEREIKH